MPTPPSPRRAASRRRRALAGVLVAGLLGGGLLGACASEPERADVVDALRKAGLDEGVARCVADAFEELPKEDRELIAERGANGVRDDQDVDDEPIDEVRRKMSACRDLATTTTTEAVTSMSTSTTEVDTTTTETTDPGDGG